MAQLKVVETPGPGRPEGALGKRDSAFAERLLASGKCPVEALTRLAQRAEAEGKLNLAKSAYVALMPFIHVKPKSVVSDIEAVADLICRVEEAKRKDQGHKWW